VGEFIVTSAEKISKSLWLFNNSCFIWTAYIMSSGTVSVND